MMADRSTPSVLPPNYPQKFRPPMPQTKEGWRAAYITLGALGGMAADAATGAVAGCIRHRGEDCGFFGGLAGAPIGATAAGVTVALLTR
jgi:hypothetical protein